MPRIACGDTRDKILSAAEDRLWRYGFKKTTIDEIAADAGVGKGTVYLYFDSKEDIALAIIAHYKKQRIAEMRVRAADPTLDPEAKLFELLYMPVKSAYDKCAAWPAAQDLILAIRPFVRAHMSAYMDEENAIIAHVLDEGVNTGMFNVEDTAQAARTLKMMCVGFLPPHDRDYSADTLKADLEQVVALAIRGLRGCGENHAVKRSGARWNQESKSNAGDGMENGA